MSSPADKNRGRELLAAAQTIKADGAAAEVSRALRAVGIRSVVVKGPSTARRLYDASDHRVYTDCDLLLSPSGFELARPVLQGLGFTEHSDSVDWPERGLPHAVPWSRSDGAQIDLHRNLSGTGVPPAAVWRELIQHTEPLVLAGEIVEVPDAKGVAFQVALHAGQHQDAPAGKPRADLARAVARIPADVWVEAAAMADRLDATGPFAIGLRLDPDGNRLADELALPSTSSVAAARDGRIAGGLGRLAATQGLGARARLVLGEFFPSPEFMRWWSPLARRGDLGLLAAYPARAFWMLRHLRRSLAAARRG